MTRADILLAEIVFLTEDLHAASELVWSLGAVREASAMTTAERRPYRTWRCNRCGVEFDYFTYGGPCPEDNCGGELEHLKPQSGAPQGPLEIAGKDAAQWGKRVR